MKIFVLTAFLIFSDAFSDPKDLGVPIENEIQRIENLMKLNEKNIKNEQIDRLSKLYLLNSRCSDVLALNDRFKQAIDNEVLCLCTKGEFKNCPQIEQIGLIFQLHKLMKEKKVFSQPNLAIFMNDLENTNEARYQLVKYYHITEEHIPAKYKKRIIQWEKELQTY